jgi:hypothetical protein
MNFRYAPTSWLRGNLAKANKKNTLAIAGRVLLSHFSYEQKPGFILETDNGNSAPTHLKFSPNVHSYSIGDELILFDDSAKQLFRTNPTATIIWKGCQAGLSLEEIIAVLSEATGTAVEQISEDVKDIISHWREMGLLHESPGLTVIERQSADAGQPENNLAYNGPVPPPASNGLEYRFRIIDTCFHLSVPTEKELHLVTPLLDHLSVSNDTAFDERLYIVHAADRYLLLHNTKVVDWCFHISEIAPILHGHSLMIAYEMSHCLFGVHAASVLCGGKSVLLPALAGSGKSTLTAALVGSGAFLCADDMVLLTPSPIRMRPVPVVIGLKSGSWDLLAPYHPHIASLPIHLRADDKHVRYLAPPVDAMVSMTSQPFPVDAIVIPKFVNDPNAVGLKEISPADGLCRLTEAGFDIHDEMTPACVKELVDWITNLPCYEMHFNKLDKAVSAILKLVS